MIRRFLVFSTLLAAFLTAMAPSGSDLADDTTGAEECVPIGELTPQVGAGRPVKLGLDVGPDGSPARWSAGKGDTLRLTLWTASPGDYELLLRGATIEDPSLNARMWGAPLTRRGETRLSLDGPSRGGMVDLRLDPFPLGPGYQWLELEALTDGDIQLACIGLRRTGAMTARNGRSASAAAQRPFLGVELGPSRVGGVTIRDIVPNTAADRAGLQAGDILLKFGGTTTSSGDALTSAIRARSVGARVELELLRDGEPLTREAVIGARPDERVTRRSQAEHVLEVLQVRPGQTIADLGCGSGWLSEAIAEEVGRDGRVYAVEIQEDHIRRLHERSVPNLLPVLSAENDVFLPENSLDTAMLHDVASHIDRSVRGPFYESVMRALKPGGRLVVFGPHGDAEKMLRVLRDHGFVPVDADALEELSSRELDERLDTGIVFRKPS